MHAPLGVEQDGIRFAAGLHAVPSPLRYGKVRRPVVVNDLFCIVVYRYWLIDGDPRLTRFRFYRAGRYSTIPGRV